MYYLFIILSLTINEKLNRATYLYENRHEMENYLEECKLLIEEVLNEDKENEEALWNLSKIYYTLGDRATSKEEKFKFYEKGMNLAERLIKINKKNPEGHFWYGVNFGRIGQLKGVMKSLSSVPTIKKEFETTLKLNPEHTGAMDGLAVLYYELPGLFGGNLDKSFEFLHKAMEIDSNFSILYIDFAKVYTKKKNYEKAREYLRKMLKLENPTHQADFILKDEPEAKKLLAEIGGKR